MQRCMQNHFDTLKIIFMLLSSTLWENIFAFNLWNDIALILIFKKSKIKWICYKAIKYWAFSSLTGK